MGLLKMYKVLIVFGTRPEAIKMAPLVKEFKKHPEIFDVRVCVTAQHREMLDQVLDLFEIIPEYDLNIMQPNQDLNSITSNIIVKIKDVFKNYVPNLVLVHGDTTTSFAASLSAFYEQIPVGHIEAGLRTGNIYSPFPEEMNRKLTGVIATYNFSPTSLAKDNLLKENKNNNSILVTGNTVIDSLFFILDKIDSNNKMKQLILKNINTHGYDLNRNKKIILVTAHRRENQGQGFINICNSIKELANNNQEVDIVFPVHLNPKITHVANKLLSGVANIFLITPLSYEQFIYLMKKSYFIITDSGGIQEEAPSLGKPVLVMRESTERPEALDAGTIRLVGSKFNKIIMEADNLIHDNSLYNKMQNSNNPYGDGKASYRIVAFFIELTKK
jgi:UDP-N-acetylglucosamine 2-epimerase (non-hydrolysing)